MSTTRYGVKYKNADFGFTGGISDHYRLAAAYANAHGGTVYEVGGPDDPEPIRKRAQNEQTALALAALDRANTTKASAPQEENFDDLC